MDAHEDVLLCESESGQESLILRDKRVTVSRFCTCQLRESPDTPVSVEYLLPRGGLQTMAMGTGSCGECRTIGVKASAVGGGSVSVEAILVPVSRLVRELYRRWDGWWLTQVLRDRIFRPKLPIHPIRLFRIARIPDLLLLLLRRTPR